MTVPADLPNPFLGGVVSDPWMTEGVDVPQIHAAVFEECCRALEELRGGEPSGGIVIHGRAGSGKTHLLRRLRRAFAATETPPTDPAQPRQIFSSIRLQTSPGMIWRYVRRRFTIDLLRSPEGGISQLDQLLRYRMAELRPAIGHLDLWWQYLWDEHPDAIEELLEHLASHDQFDFSTTAVLRHFLRGTHRREVLAWLRGEPLPDAALEQLGVKAAGEEAADPEAEARDTVISLCALAGPQVPVVLCFDQVESLQADSDDKAGLFAFGQLVATLHNDTRNVLIVSCMQSAFLDELRRVIRGADYDRICSRATLGLGLLRFPEAAALVKSRLDASQPLAPLRAGRGDLWPLSEADVREAVGDQGCTPRELLKYCAERFFVLQRGSDEPPSIEESLRLEWEGRVERAIAANRSEETESIVARALPFLISIAAPDWKKQDKESKLRDVDLVFSPPGADARVGVSLCTQGNMTSLAARLRRLREQQAQGNLRRLILIRDPRTPIGAQAAKANEYLDELRAAGAIFHQPSPELLAALDAFASLLSDAQSGDLSAGGDTVPARTVRDWLAAHLAPELARFAESIAGGVLPAEKARERGFDEITVRFAPGRG